MARRTKGPVKIDPKREGRINNEIVVDAYDEEEKALAWYYYLEGRLCFTFESTCVHERAISLLRVGDLVDVIGLPPEHECRHEMFVLMRWEKRGLAVPLSQLKPNESADEPTKEAVADWHYWVRRGYQF